MNQFESEGVQLILERYPLQEASSALQAWDAADEYLLQAAKTGLNNARPLLLFNDSFGALACALHAHQPISISDSYLSQLATQQNLKLNNLAQEGVQLLDSMAPLSITAGTVLMKLPRTTAQLEQQLQMVRQIADSDTQIIAAAKARDIHSSTLQLFEKHFGPTKTSLAKKKARLIYSQLGNTKFPVVPETVQWPLEGTEYVIHNHANVFARSGLDIGARLFLAHLPKGIKGRMVDLGCGNGVIGLKALERNPEAELLFVDESYMAVASSKINVASNRPQDSQRCQFEVNDGLAGVEAESLGAVLCNPPFHQLSVLTDEIAWQMFVDSRRCLQENGELWVVGNRHLGYHQKLKHLFGNCKLIASNQKFVVLTAIKAASVA